MRKIDTVIFVSNYFNHHQKYISDAFFSRLGKGYQFIETEEMDQERRDMGWEMNDYPSYVIACKTFYRDKEYFLKLIAQADVVIIGAAPHSLIRPRIKNNKLTFQYSERPLKKGLELWKYPYRFLRWHMCGFSKPCMYMLCASAYTAQDYAKFCLFRNRCFKWGYFPRTYQYDDLDDLIQAKTKNSMIWVARFLDWKHPEIAVELAKRLKNDGYSFEINMIGDGPLKDNIADLIKRENLVNSIHLLGVMSPDEVRSHMEKAEIHIFTSDRNEGWGAVLNEAMNSGCAVVASSAIGSVPYLIEDGINGMVYTSGNVEQLTEKVKYLLDHPREQTKLGLAAYETIVAQWNAETAAKRFVQLAEAILSGENHPDIFDNGPCSISEMIY